MKKQILMGWGIGIALTMFSCGEKENTKEENTTQKEEKLDCWIGSNQANCDLAKSYDRAKTLAIEFKTANVGGDFDFEKALHYNDSILNLIEPLKSDLVKIKEMIGESDYQLYFSSIEKQKEINDIYREKIEVISKIVLKPSLLKFNSKHEDRDIAYTIENNSSHKIEMITLHTTFLDKNGEVLYFDEGDAIGAHGFVPNTGGDFFPPNYKGKGSNTILSIYDAETLKKIASVKHKIVDVKLK